MRPLETITIITAVATLVTLCIRQKAKLVPFYFVILSVISVLIQILIEGARWQMVPVYVLVGVYVIGLFAYKRIPFFDQRWVKTSAIVLGIVWAAIAIALPLVLPIFYFDQPTGKYGVGTVTYNWVDTSRTELFTANAADHRELTAQVWYPVDKQAQVGKKYAQYMENASYVLPALTQVFSGAVAKVPSFTLSHIGYVKSSATLDTPIATTQQSFPVLIYLTGLGGGREFSMFQVQELVSQGYVVVGLDQPGASASVVYPDGRHVDVKPKSEMQPIIDQSVNPQSVAPSLNGTALPDGIIPYFSQDVSFAIGQLEKLNTLDKQLVGHLDLEKLGVFGISLGGMVAGQACASDVRLKACLIMDVAMTKDTLEKGLKQPTMWLTRTADMMRNERSKFGGWSEADIKSTQDTMH
ncbi:hypothetical protein H7Y29_01965 [Microbacteriaceae bacterium]|nr:hypothetical protein [Candidatus Saccharibacteria bacterium]